MIYHYEPLQNRSCYYSKNDYKKSITCIAINSIKEKNIAIWTNLKKTMKNSKDWNKQNIYCKEQQKNYY